ncbi:MAG: DNA-directed RNA polymerase subunit A'', partial [Candidatus Diapherotrites archaeon]|nr:DNA-directed RNA polymerase subunit A'' [Candidatus Diapherotrites archaeon]
IQEIHKAMAVKEGDEYIIKTRGSNLLDVLTVEEIDPTRTTSNSIKEVQEVFGIEAARSIIITEIQAAMGSARVDVRHLMLLSDVMTRTGEVRAIGRTGISGQKESVFARAAYEVTIKHLLDAAINGEVEKLAGVTENIIVGQPVKVGTGNISLVMKN